MTHTTTPTLGALLQQNINQAVQAAERMAQREREREAIRQREANDTVKRFFDQTISQVTQEIQAGQIAKPTRISSLTHAALVELLDVHGGVYFPFEGHPYVSFWLDFEQWAAANELKVGCTHQVDPDDREVVIEILVAPAPVRT